MFRLRIILEPKQVNFNLTGNYLENFIKRNDSISLSVEFLKHSNNLHVQLFALSTIEVCFYLYQISLNRKWHLISHQEKENLKTEVIRLLFNDSQMVNNLLSNLCKIFMLIGRNDFQSNFKDFFKIIEEVFYITLSNILIYKQRQRFIQFFNQITFYAS